MAEYKQKSGKDEPVNLLGSDVKNTVENVLGTEKKV